MLEIIDKGGLISWGLLLLSVLTLTLIILKILHLFRLTLGKTAFVPKVLEAVQNQKMDVADAVLKNNKNPIAEIMSQALQLHQEGTPTETLKAQVQVMGTLGLSRLRSLLPWLDTIAHIAPMLGLLGTVVGMIKAFKSLSDAGAQVDITLLSTGIWEALLTTAIGLVISVVALIAVNSFESQIDRTRDTMSIAVSKLMLYLGH